MNVSPEEVETARHAAIRSAEMFRLPFRRELWRGAVGNWAGAGVGSSIEFQDHRPYVPGDDPRYIDWHAYARSDLYVMKLYREEVSPAVDLVLDVSASMAVDAAKKRRALELFFFVLESALAAGAAPRPWVVTAGGAERWDVDTARRGASAFERGAERVDVTLLERVGFRPGSLRVLVSDCLFPGEPELVLTALAASKGRAIVLAPCSEDEARPEWRGPTDLEDCETGLRRIEYVDDARIETYQAAYRRHFQLWEDGCRRRGMPFARIPAEPDLSEALRSHALLARAVEPRA